MLGQQPAVLLLLPRIAREILVRPELRRIDEERRDDLVGAAPRLLDQRHVPRVERTHGWHQREPCTAQFGTGACQFFTGTNDLHPSPRSVNLRVGGALGAPWEKIKPKGRL